MPFAIAVCPNLLVGVVLQILYFLIKVYRRAELWAPRLQTPVRSSAQEESIRVLIGDEADVGPSEAQSIPHNHLTPREHDERQIYRRAELWAPRLQTPVRGSSQEESCRVLIGDEADVGPSESQNIPHNHRTPREHDERQSSNESSSAVDGMIQ